MKYRDTVGDALNTRRCSFCSTDEIAPKSETLARSPPTPQPSPSPAMATHHHHRPPPPPSPRRLLRPVSVPAPPHPRRRPRPPLASLQPPTPPLPPLPGKRSSDPVEANRESAAAAAVVLEEETGAREEEEGYVASVGAGAYPAAGLPAHLRAGVGDPVFFLLAFVAVAVRLPFPRAIQLMEYNLSRIISHFSPRLLLLCVMWRRRRRRSRAWWPWPSLRC
jgi:hypothetical protein